MSDERKVLEVSTPQCEGGPDRQNETVRGPLISARIQKEDVMRFIQGKCQDCLLHVDDPDHQKSYFFWLMMELLCNKNGKVMMAEIGALLFKGYGHVRRQPGHVKDQEDWCLPLATLLCSTAEACELRTAIIELGDKFDSVGLFYAAHTCYVVAQLDLGSRKCFNLIGSEWFPLYKAIPVEALERTEVYEYVRSLTSGIGQPCFQEAKYFHATNLARSGHTAQALEFCENVSRNICQTPRLIKGSVIDWVIVLSKKLLNRLNDQEPTWLLKLLRVQEAFGIRSPNPVQDSSHTDVCLEFQEELDSRYIVGELLGKGSFGTVYAGVCKADGKQVAIKYVNSFLDDRSPGEKPLEVVLTEIVSKPPHCESVVEMLEWIEISHTFVLVLERPMPSMDLRTFRRNKKQSEVSELMVREIFQQVFQAARHCFDRGIFHGDIRTENILINPETLKVKLIDFGCGQLMSDYKDSKAGLPPYFWSLGIVLAELISGDINYFVVNNILETCSNFISKEGCHLISCFLTNREGSLHFDDIQDHVWFTMELPDRVQAR